LLDQAARVKSKWTSPLDFGEGDIGPDLDYTSRPYPSAGSSYELELYLTVNTCEGLARGFYHYDAERHALVPIPARPHDMEAQLSAASFGMDAPSPPQILVTIAARFNRIAWKYSAIAYSLILKDVGVLLQTLYLAATDLGLGGCAIGTSNIDLFARMTGQPFHGEGPVGQFALGRPLLEGSDELPAGHR
jgi:SagB-type dehydrogenase family enzyme